MRTGQHPPAFCGNQRLRFAGVGPEAVRQLTGRLRHSADPEGPGHLHSEIDLLRNQCTPPEALILSPVSQAASPDARNTTARHRHRRWAAAGGIDATVPVWRWMIAMVSSANGDNPSQIGIESCRALPVT